MTKAAIAYLGLGSMGIAMAGRFLEAGHPLSVWNRNADKAADLVAKGAVLSSTPEETVRTADFVFSMVSTTERLTALLSVCRAFCRR